MIDEHGLTEKDRPLQLAATMIEVFRERYDCSEVEMDFVVKTSLAVLFKCWDAREDPPKVKREASEARTIVLAAVGRISGVIAGIAAARDGRTVN